MSLGLSVYHSAGEFSPRVEFNAKSGRITRVDRSADGATNVKTDITMSQPVFAWDIGSVEIGWANFQALMVPSFRMVAFGQPMPERPDTNHKAGFRSRIWLAGESDRREFSSTAGVTVAEIESLWDQLTASPEAAAGKVPVIRLVNVTAIAGARGTNYAPVFTVIQWIERDERVFGPRTVAAPGAPPIVPVLPPPPTFTPAPAAPTPAAWPTQAAPATPAAWPVAA